MSDRMRGGDAAVVTPVDFDVDAVGPEAVAARLIGRTPTPTEVAESAGYDDLREMLRLAREDAEMSQAAIAGRMGVVQSEVSRLETTIGPGTRFGRLCKYLDACEAEVTLAVRTSQGRQLVWSTGSATAESGRLMPPTTEQAMRESAMTLAPALRIQMLDDILALDDSLQQTGMGATESLRVRQAFLRQLQAKQRAEPLAAAQFTAAPIGGWYEVSTAPEKLMEAGTAIYGTPEAPAQVQTRARQRRLRIYGPPEASAQVQRAAGRMRSGDSG